MKLSLAMIVKNEEKNIIRCLESCYKIFDEIIIVDTGSIDKTKDRILEFCSLNNKNLKLFDFKWIDDFSAARNFSFEQCDGDWIMWLDADDVLIFPEKIREYIENHNNDEIIFAIYHYVVNDKLDPIIKQYRERIIKRTSNIKWEYPIHECMKGIHDKKHSFVNESLFHIKHLRTIKDIEFDKNRNLEILKRHYEKYKNDHRYIYHYANELYYCGKHKDAFDLYCKLPGLDGFLDEKYFAYINMYEISKQMKYDNCHQYLWDAIKICPYYKEAHFLLGKHYFEMKDYIRAIHFFDVCLKSKFRESLLITRKDFNDKECYQMLEFCFDRIGDYERTLEICEKLLEYHPGLSSLLSDSNFCREKIIEKYRKIIFPINGKICLNLGAGGQKIDGFYGCDKYDKNAELRFDMKFILMANKTVDIIRSEHSMEHLTHINAIKFLNESYRVLKCGGILDLEIPNFEECAIKYLSAVRGDRYVEANWYRMTLFGRQYTENKIDNGQFHLTGYTKDQIIKMLQEIGFGNINVELMNKYGTPSLKILSVKIPTVYFFDSGTIENATSRIRRKNVYDKYIKSIYKEQINLIMIDKFDLIDIKRADVVIFTSFDEQSMNKMKECKNEGIKIWYDHNEAILQFPGVKEALSYCDKVLCCTEKLKELTEEITGIKNCVVLEDSWEINENAII